jgi:glycosyltransferase involved in cell wall biosynthesis
MIVTSMPWGFLWQRPHQIAARLANRGFDVVYFHSPFGLSPSFLIKLFREKKLFIVERVRPNLRIINLFVPPFRGKLRLLTDELGALLLRAYITWFGLKPSVAIFYNPRDVFLVNCLKSMGVRIFYDCVDDYSAFPGVRNPLKVLRDEQLLINESSFVFVVSKKLFSRVSKINSNCVFIPNGADFEHFNSAVGLQVWPSDVKSLKRPILGFIGAIWDWIDVDLICKLAELHPEYSVLLVGPVYFGREKLLKHPNIYAVGHKQYKVLPRYLACMDVCLVPFKINRLTLASNPIKLYEYLSAGKPVVSTALPEVCENASGLVYIAKDEGDFIRKVEEAVKEAESPNKELIMRRIKFAKENSWEKRIDVIEKLLRNFKL